MQLTNSTQNDITAKIIQRKNLLIKDGKHKKKLLLALYIIL